MRQQVAMPANSCVAESGVSFLDQVIHPLYDVLAAVCPIFLFSRVYSGICVLVALFNCVSYTKSNNMYCLHVSKV